LGGQDHRGGAIVYAGGVARSHRAIGWKKTFKLSEHFHGAIRPRMLVLLEAGRTPFGIASIHGYNFRVMEGAGSESSGLAPSSECVLVLARDIVVAGDIFPGLRHRIDTITTLHCRIYEPPPDCGVLDLGRSGE